ncbi:helix-turn-helix domain-containing protein [Spiribacter halobius]|uniref:XRE family transcriptional regulator n=1 Tax=Sediminicurvatus halobius TaxID=2182432 RepID=A0A2U2MYE7_9GAMM|nr:helix-turn-helix transcriptional regulator [Spiribacter halobius]PWG61838.1 XRE family transcriptional regulator [Spiribacter halobius]UEX77680.1 helix-turn-helix transcriptional regulator [Spiribacter halobius]
MPATALPGVFSALRSALKARRVTYAELARRLGVSEPSIKRLFQQQDCKLSRLAAICEAIDLPLETLIEAADQPARPSEPLPLAAERALARNAELFHFLLLLLDRFTPGQIGRTFGLSQASVDLYLRDLERLGIIERDVGERFRFLVPLPVAWRWSGPLGPELKRINQDFIGWVVDRQSEPGVEFLSLTRRMRPETASALQLEANALSERLRQAAHRDQLLCDDSELRAVKLTLGLAPLAIQELRLVGEHAEAGARRRGRTPGVG